MAARPEDYRVGSQASEERRGPGADDYRRLVVDENDIETTVWQDAVNEDAA